MRSGAKASHARGSDAGPAYLEPKNNSMIPDPRNRAATANGTYTAAQTVNPRSTARRTRLRVAAELITGNVAATTAMATNSPVSSSRYDTAYTASAALPL